ncbi:MAG: hypothetical protein Q3976_07415 [Corynebacterium sp.]|nr:hypothetical protein [Corynebacterium sp.]
MKHFRLAGLLVAGALLAPPAIADEAITCPENLTPPGLVDAPAPRAASTKFHSCGLNLPESSTPPKVSADSWLIFKTGTNDVIATDGPHNRYVVGDISRVVVAAVTTLWRNPDEVLSNGHTVSENLKSFLNGNIDSSIFEFENIILSTNTWLADLPISDTMINAEDLAMSTSPVDLARIVHAAWEVPAFQDLFYGSDTTTGITAPEAAASTDKKDSSTKERTSSTTSSSESSATSTSVGESSESASTSSALESSASSTTSAITSTQNEASSTLSDQDSLEILASYGYTNPFGETTLFTVTPEKTVVLFNSTAVEEDTHALLALDGNVGTIEPYVATPEPVETHKPPRGFVLGGLVALLTLGVTVRKLS